MMKFKAIITSLVLIPALAYAKETAVLRFSQNNQTTMFTAPLMKLDSQQKKAIKESIVSYKMPESKLASRVNLTMNGVPVLNQGIHPTCVSFALIAALDALKGAGDYYSPLCLLNLGKYIEQNGYKHSGWNYAENLPIFNRIREFGLVPTHIQKTYGCGGITQYPTDTNDNSMAMTPEDYHRYSENMRHSGFNDYNFFVKDHNEVNSIINFSRQALNNGHRLVLMFASPVDEHNGIHGSYKTTQDSWVLSDELAEKLKNQSEIDQLYGHDVVVVGYDDEVVIKDFQGKTHLGAVIVRNSWGEGLGNHGDFFISYDFLTALGLELLEII